MTRPDVGKILNNINLNAILLAGAGLTRPDDIRTEKFNERIRSGEFAQSKLIDVSANLMRGLQRLWDHTSAPTQFFLHGRRYQMAHDHFCKELAIPNGGKALGFIDDGESKAEQLDLLMKLSKKMYDWMNGDCDDPSWTPSIFSSEDVAAAALRGHAMTGIVESLSRSLIIEAWTIFESLAEEWPAPAGCASCYESVGGLNVCGWNGGEA